jgi:hypothetical protein
MTRHRNKRALLDWRLATRGAKNRSRQYPAPIRAIIRVRLRLVLPPQITDRSYRVIAAMCRGLVGAVRVLCNEVRALDPMM